MYLILDFRSLCRRFVEKKVIIIIISSNTNHSEKIDMCCIMMLHFVIKHTYCVLCNM